MITEEQWNDFKGFIEKQLAETTVAMNLYQDEQIGFIRDTSRDIHNRQYFLGAVVRRQERFSTLNAIYNRIKRMDPVVPKGY